MQNVGTASDAATPMLKLPLAPPIANAWTDGMHMAANSSHWDNLRSSLMIWLHGWRRWRWQTGLQELHWPAMVRPYVRLRRGKMCSFFSGVSQGSLPVDQKDSSSQNTITLRAIRRYYIQ